MIRRMAFVGAGALVLLAGCATHWDVDSFEAPDGNVAARHTYFWQGGDFGTPGTLDPAMVASASTQLRGTVTAELNRKGFQGSRHGGSRRHDRQFPGRRHRSDFVRVGREAHRRALGHHGAQSQRDAAAARVDGAARTAGSRGIGPGVHRRPRVGPPDLARHGHRGDTQRLDRAGRAPCSRRWRTRSRRKYRPAPARRNRPAQRRITSNAPASSSAAPSSRVGVTAICG